MTALAGVSFEIHERACLGLLGPNGAGKSTLIRSIVGRVRPDPGNIGYSVEPANSAAARAAMGWVPQELALYPLLTCRENLEAFGRYQGLRGKALREAIEWCLEWAALADRADTTVKTLSGGMRRRLNMAAGLIHRPRIVLLDEPTVGVDPQSRNRIFEMVEDLRDQGTTVIYTTHYMEEAERLCDRIAIMDHGRVIAEGTKEELVAQSFGRRSDVLMRFALRPARRSRMGGARGGTLEEAWRISPWRGPPISRRCWSGERCGPRSHRRGAAPAQSRIRVSATHRKGSAPMIATIVRNGFRALRRDRGALILSFVLPIAFFSIFGVVFGGMGRADARRASACWWWTRIAARFPSAWSGPAARALVARQHAPRSQERASKRPVPPDYTAATAEAAVKTGRRSRRAHHSQRVWRESRRLRPGG